jgi:GAF domain
MAGMHERYERLVEAGLALAAELSLPAALQRIVELAAELAGARYGALGVLGRDGTITEFITTGVTDDQRAAIGPIPCGKGILGVLIDDARPLRLHDLTGDPRAVGFPPSHPPMRTFLGVPVTAGGQVYGNLYLTEKQDGADFDADDERVLVLLAAPGRGGDPERPPLRGGARSRPAAGGGTGHQHRHPGRHRQRPAAGPGRGPCQGWSVPIWPPWPCPRDPRSW